eukprot:3687923-Amphidinium_carterae.1
MRRECALATQPSIERVGRLTLDLLSINRCFVASSTRFFQLPDEVPICCDTPHHVTEMLDAMRGIRKAVLEIEENLTSVTSRLA